MIGDNRAYHNGTVFGNPQSFQLYTYGMDGFPGDRGPVAAVGPGGVDNIVNFAVGGGPGKLETVAF